VILALAPAALAQRVARTAVFNERNGPVQRAWLEYRPPGVPSAEPLATVFVLHPGASTPSNVADNSRWDLVADQHRLMIIYPAASPGETSTTGVWNSWDWDGAPTPNGLGPTLAARDDIGFLVQLTNLVVTRAGDRADPARRYMTGFSSGTQMAVTFAGAGRAEVAAYAPVSGGWCEPFGVPADFCRPAAPVPVWMWRGQGEDSLTPGGVSRLVHDQLQLAFWLDYVGSGVTPDLTESRTATGVRTVMGSANTVTVTHNTQFYTQGAAEIRYTEVPQGTHEYQVGASERIWTEFFSRFQRPPCPADFNLDSAADADDLFDFLDAWFATDLRADVNNDSAVDADDIFFFLAQWFAGC
jgi:poly(3-hydroxybutyrate) depolymerase